MHVSTETGEPVTIVASCSRLLVRESDMYKHPGVEVAVKLSILILKLISENLRKPLFEFKFLRKYANYLFAMVELG